MMKPTAARLHDVFADTSVSTDALGRRLPRPEVCGPPRPLATGDCPELDLPVEVVGDGGSAAGVVGVDVTDSRLSGC